MPIYTHQTKNSHFLKNRRFSVWCGWVFTIAQGDVKKFALRCDKKRENVYTMQKKCLWEFFDTWFALNFFNKHSWQILKILECAITHFSFLVKNREINCGLRRIFYGSLTSDFFVIFTFEIFFWYLRPKKDVTEDGRRKLKNWHSKIYMRKWKKAA